LGLPIFSKKKIAIFWLEKKTRFFEKIGKKAAKISKKRQKLEKSGIKSPIRFFFCHSFFCVCGAAREEVCGGHQTFLRCAKAG
jgi:hypothetical protein